jgi:hypothetical protein
VFIYETVVHQVLVFQFTISNNQNSNWSDLN